MPSRLRKILVENIEKCGYSEPTPVQQFSIPFILSGRDLMCCAQTGSGKTAAFVLPILHKLLEDGTTRHKSQTDRVARPEALIIAPTRYETQLASCSSGFFYSTTEPIETSASTKGQNLVPVPVRRFLEPFLRYGS